MTGPTKPLHGWLLTKVSVQMSAPQGGFPSPPRLRLQASLAQVTMFAFQYLLWYFLACVHIFNGPSLTRMSTLYKQGHSILFTVVNKPEGSAQHLEST